MKRSLCLLVALVCWVGAGAQDVILLRNADEVKAVVQEITDSHLLYKEWGGSDKVFSLPRTEIFSVTYQNGEKELFMNDRVGAGAVSVAADYPWPKVTRSYRPGDLFDEDGLRGLVISTTDDGRHGLILSLDQARLPWIGEEHETELAGTEEAIAGWSTVEYRYHGGVLLGLSDRTDGWNNRQRLIEVMASTGFGWSDFPAFEWCEAKGRGWYLPAVEELKGLWSLLGGAAGVTKMSSGDIMSMCKRLNTYLEPNGGDVYPIRWPFIWFWSSTEKEAPKMYFCDWGCASNVMLRPYRKTYGQIHTDGGGKAAKLHVRAVHKF